MDSSNYGIGSKSAQEVIANIYSALYVKNIKGLDKLSWQKLGYFVN